MSRCRVAIVADDLTGALDAAAPFAARGADTRVVIAPERLEATLSSWAEGDWPQVIAVNTESRHLAAGEAAERVADAVRQLAALAPAVWFKKIDSTLRGQVIAESLAMREVTGRRLLVAPAVPAQGRVVRDAEVWVEGVPLAESPYAGDARSRPLPGPLDRAFAAAGLPLARHRQTPGGVLPAGDCVADAESDRELACLYDTALRDPDAWLLVGAAGLAAAIAQRSFGRLHASPPGLGRVARCLYALGSRSPRADEQRQRLQAAVPSLVPVEALGAGEVPTTSALLLVPGGDPQATLDPTEVARAMGTRVAEVVADWPADAEGLLFLTGGDIAVAALRRLGANTIAVAAVWAPGVALGTLDGDPRRRVMTKAGGFGEPELLVRLHGRLTGLEDGVIH